MSLRVERAGAFRQTIRSESPAFTDARLESIILIVILVILEGYHSARGRRRTRCATSESPHEHCRRAEGAGTRYASGPRHAISSQAS